VPHQVAKSDPGTASIKFEEITSLDEDTGIKGKALTKRLGNELRSIKGIQ